VSRELLPPEKVDEVEHHWPTACEKVREQAERGSDRGREPQRHQVVEIPAVQAHVTEHQMHTQCCDACGHATQAEPARGVPPGLSDRGCRPVMPFSRAPTGQQASAESALSICSGEAVVGPCRRPSRR